VSYKKLLSDTAIYGLSSIVGRALNLLLVPFYTDVLTMDDFGVMSTIFVITAFLNEVFRYGMETTYFKYASVEDEQKVFNQIQTSLWGSTLSLAMFCLVLVPSLSSYLGYENRAELFYLAIGLISIDAVSAVLFGRLRHKNKAKCFSVVKLVSIFLNIGLNILFLVVMKNHPLVEGIDKLVFVFVSYLIANGIGLLLLLPQLSGYRVEFSLGKFKEMLRYAFPLLIAGLFYIANEMIDRIMLNKLLPDGFYKGLNTDEAIGVYSACYKLTVFLTLGSQAFRYAAEPLFFKKSEDKDGKEFYATSLRFVTLAGSIVVVLISFFRNEIGGIIIRNINMLVGLDIVPVLLLANLFLLMYSTQSIWYKLDKSRTHFGLIISGIGISITLAVNYFLIPYWGYMASAWATLACYGSMSVISYFLGQQHYPVPYERIKILLYLLATTILVFLEKSFSFNYFVKIILLVSFLFMIFIVEKKSIQK